MKLKLISLLVILIGTCLSLFLLLLESSRTTSATSGQKIEEQTSNAAQAEPTIKKPEKNDAPTVDMSKTNLPIFMYHYLREYNDPNDTIGTNLSVSPETFSGQLDLISQAGYQPVTFKDLQAGQITGKPIILTFDDGYLDFYTNAYPELKKRQITAVIYIITDRIGQNNYLSTSQIKEVSEYGIEIGSHTRTHPDLSATNNNKAQIEIGESKKVLEQITGKPVIGFCYPSGKYTAEISATIKNNGYLYATTTKSGVASFDKPFELKRYRIENDTDISKYLK